MWLQKFIISTWHYYVRLTASASTSVVMDTHNSATHEMEFDAWKFY